MFSIVVGEYTLNCQDQTLPPVYDQCLQHARLVEKFDADEYKGQKCILAIKRGLDWPFLVVTQRCKTPGIFDPCALLVPETRLLFLGVGERLLAYELDGPTRVWEDTTDCGILGWARHGEYVVMSAELELAAWDIRGEKRWATFVEPPWEYRVVEGAVHLDVMGKKATFPLDKGPPSRKWFG